jgi:hypothetical protein
MASLTGNTTSTAGTVDLSTGVTDWIKWETVASTVRSSTGGSLIGNYTKLGIATDNAYTNDPRTLTWTGGTPTSTGSSTNGLYSGNAAGTGAGYQIVFPADTATRTIKLYFGDFDGRGTIVATLSDASTGPLTLVAADSPGTETDVNGTITYSAASASQTLTIAWTLSTNHGGGNVTICGANMTVIHASDVVPMTGGGRRPSNATYLIMKDARRAYSFLKRQRELRAAV